MGSSVKELIRNGPKPWLKIIAESVDIVDFKVLGDIGVAGQILRKNNLNVLVWSNELTDEKETVSSTTNTNFTNFFNFSPTLTLGTYKFEYTFEMRNVTATGTAFGELRAQSLGEVFMDGFSADKQADEWTVFSGFKIRAAISGLQTMEFNGKRGVAGTMEMRKMRIIITQIA